MKDNYLDGQIKAIEKMEKSGLTEAQVNAIIGYFEFELEFNNDWTINSDNDVKIEVRRELKEHRHIANGEVYHPL